MTDNTYGVWDIRAGQWAVEPVLGQDGADAACDQLVADGWDDDDLDVINLAPSCAAHPDRPAAECNCDPVLWDH